ncbi:uncharacterized protein LOC114729738 [Neltuma alba]|uniref:uncharacterized protein LOC114729738 n=1 Tax=Neltuma alba TaxID=207710 RepID=UPI0010A592F5|nr:uncharacterized protein LOC114729738 [Prosopis alba]
MNSLVKKKREITPITKTPYKTSHDISDESDRDEFCTRPCCFFCSVKEADTYLKRAELGKFFREMHLRDNQEHVLVLSGLWHIAMNQPNDPEFPSLGIFKCMANLIYKAMKDRNWLLTNQNIYTPYYAAHIIGSYTINKEEYAQIAVQSGVIPQLMELLRGKMSWIEQRVAVRALGHLASYESTFEAVAEYEQELVKLAKNLASTCLEVIFVKFVGLKDVNKRLKYHRKLLTRGIGGVETENSKAEEWASQLQCWSLQLLNCFACKERSVNLIGDLEFLEDLCDMWGGIMNYTSPAGVGLIRILCYSKIGRKNIAESPKVIHTLGNLSRSSDDWQYLGIDCLLLLLKDPQTRCKVIDLAVSYLIDLIELENLGDRSNVGETIMRVLLLEHNQRGISKPLPELLHLEVDRRNKEKLVCEEKLEETMVLISSIKQQAKHMFWLGEVEEAVSRYTEALDLCPVRYRKERMVLYSNRAQCHLVLRDPDSAISDSTRALSLCNPANTHGKSLWRRSQAYDMKGMAKESLMDCVMLMNGCIKIPYHAARMLCKQMDATWLFGPARSKVTLTHCKSVVEETKESNGRESNYEGRPHVRTMLMKSRGLMPGLSTIAEQALLAKEGERRKMEVARSGTKAGVGGAEVSRSKWASSR